MGDMKQVHTEESKTFGATVQNIVVWALCTSPFYHSHSQTVCAM